MPQTLLLAALVLRLRPDCKICCILKESPIELAAAPICCACCSLVINGGIENSESDALSRGKKDLDPLKKFFGLKNLTEIESQ